MCSRGTSRWRSSLAIGSARRVMSPRVRSGKQPSSMRTGRIWAQVTPAVNSSKSSDAALPPRSSGISARSSTIRCKPACSAGSTVAIRCSSPILGGTRWDTLPRIQPRRPACNHPGYWDKNYGPTPLDIRHNPVVSGVVELAFRQRQALGPERHRRGAAERVADQRADSHEHGNAGDAGCSGNHVERPRVRPVRRLPGPGRQDRRTHTLVGPNKSRRPESGQSECTPLWDMRHWRLARAGSYQCGYGRLPPVPNHRAVERAVPRRGIQYLEYSAFRQSQRRSCHPETSG